MILTKSTYLFLFSFVLFDFLNMKNYSNRKRGTNLNSFNVNVHIEVHSDLLTVLKFQ